jgi:hypothetical protein
MPNPFGSSLGPLWLSARQSAGGPPLLAGGGMLAMLRMYFDLQLGSIRTDLDLSAHGSSGDVALGYTALARRALGR